MMPSNRVFLILMPMLAALLFGCDPAVESAPNVSISQPQWDSPLKPLGIEAWYLDVSNLDFEPQRMQLELVFYKNGLEVGRTGSTGAIAMEDSTLGNSFKAAIYMMPDRETNGSIVFKLQESSTGTSSFQWPNEFIDAMSTLGRMSRPFEQNQQDSGPPMPLFYILFGKSLSPTGTLEGLLHYNPDGLVVAVYLKYSL